MIREGIVPPNHPSHANCLLRARKLGFKFVKKKEPHRKSDKRDALLRKGIIPQGTDMAWAIARSNELGFSFLDRVYADNDVSDVSGIKKSDKLLVMTEKGNSTRKMKTKVSDLARKAAERGKRFFLMHACSAMTIGDIARAEGCTKQNVHRLMDTFKIHYFNEHCYDEVVRNGQSEAGLVK